MSFDADYVMGDRLLGANTSSVVARCTSRHTGMQCIAKAYSRQRFSDRRIALGIEEGQLGLSIPPHPNIVQTFNCYDDTDTVTIVMECMSAGTLYEALRKSGAMPEGRAGRLLTQLLRGLVHLHSNKIMHRDIKPENLFFRTPTGQPPHGPAAADAEVLAIGDFGFATRRIPCDQCVGSPQYSAPELALIALPHHTPAGSKPLYNEKCDLWSVGIVAFVMLTGLMPFDGATPGDVFLQVIRNQLPFHLPACRNMSPGAREFILALTNVVPSKRPSAKEALAHPWLRACAQRC